MTLQFYINFHSLRFFAIGALLFGLTAFVGIPSTYAQSCDVYVDASAFRNGNGAKGNPYATLQAGLDDASEGDVICVAEGTYHPPGSSTAFTVPGGARLEGGYISGFSPETRDIANHPTILDGANVQQGNGNAARVLSAGSGSVVIDGVTIRNGNGAAGAGFSSNGWYSGTVTFRDVVFAENNAGGNDGGAVRVRGDGTVIFERVEFRKNQGGRGGALYAGTSTRVEIRNSTFVGNTSTSGGGAVYMEGSEVTMESVLAAGNLAGANGGAFSFDYSGGLSFVNVTVTGNRAEGNGGGIYIGTNNAATIENSIIWENEGESGADQIGIAYGASNLSYRHSDVQGSGGSGAWDSSIGRDEGQNIDVNPYFASPMGPALAPTVEGDVRLSDGSPALNAGDDNAVSVSTDLNGEQRIQDGTVDLGAYEGAQPVPESEVLYVDKAAGSDENTGDSWLNPLKHLQTALDRASPNSEIWIAEGVYYSDEGEGAHASPDDPTSTFAMKDRVRLYGGFEGREGRRSSRDPEAHPVVLSGDLTQDDVTNENGIVLSPSDQNHGTSTGSTNAYHVLTASGVSSQTVVDGVVVTAGSADDGNDSEDTPSRERGGGIFIHDGSPTLSDIRVIGNRARLDGGGIATFGGGGPALSEVVVVSNEADADGGGLFNADDSSLRMRFVTLRSNRAGTDGGGLYNERANVRLTNVIVEGNDASSGRGGGIYTFNSRGSTLANLRVVGNRASYGGGWFSSYDTWTGSAVTIGTSSFSGNFATNQGGAIRSEQEPIDLENSILWGNGPDQISEWENMSVKKTIVEGRESGGMNEDPLFISEPTLARSAPTTDGNLRLSPTSPAPDAGNTSYLPQDVSDIDNDGNTAEDLPLDLAGGLRVKDNRVDLGAYEGTTVERVVEGRYGADGSDAGWRDMGVPVQGATVGDVERENGVGLENISRWGVWRDINNTWTRLRDANEPLPNGRGFTVYLFDKNKSAIDPTLTFHTTAGLTPGDTDVTVGDGDPEADSALARHSRFHFLANPYAVPYNLARMENSGRLGDFQTVTQVWKAGSGYQPINVGRGASGRTGISPWQAFYVERTTLGAGPTELTFPSTGRFPAALNTHPFFGSKQTSGEDQGYLLRFRVVAETDDGRVVAEDEAANLLFHSAAEDGWDRYDATKLSPPTGRYALVGPVGQDRSGDLMMKAQESRPLGGTDDLEVPVGVKVKNVSGSLRLSLAEADNVPDSWAVRLIDTKGTADPADDEEHVLDADGDGYPFTVESSKGGREEPSGLSETGTRPRGPVPVEWSPGNASSTNKTSEKSGDEGPVARFQIRVEKDGALPVEMSGMEARVDDRSAQLRWTTASETDNAGFFVEHQRRVAGETAVASAAWSTLGFVEGAGTSDDPTQYRYDTNDLKYGTHVFRLRQVDTDGTTSRSEPVTVEVSLDEAVVIEGPNPNPVLGQASLRITVRADQEVSIQLYDLLGRRIKTIGNKHFPGQDTQVVSVTTDGLSSGTYMLRVAGDGFRKTERMTVVR